jgi:hypothetical protein
MKTLFLMLLALFLMALVFPLLRGVEALTWEFTDKAESNDWTAIRGKWEVDPKAGVFIGSSDLDEGTAIVSEKVWDPNWKDYTFEVKVRNMGTNNHFGVGFRDDSEGHHYGFYLNDAADGQYWFGFFNGAYTAFFGWGPSGGATKDAEDWNILKVEAEGSELTVYINDTLMKTVNDKVFTEGPVALVSDKNDRTAIAQFDYVRIEGEGIPELSVAASGRLAMTWGLIKGPR